MVKEHLAVVGRKDDDRIMIGLIIFQRGDQPAELMIDMGDAGIVAGHRLMAQLCIPTAVHAV